MSAPLDQDSYSETNELAKERNRAAADRTLLAWIRTSLALIGFGFGIDRIVNVISTKHESMGLSAIVGMAFMALGIYGLAAASRDYRSELQMLAKPRYVYEKRSSSGMIVAIVLAIVGALALIGVLVQEVLEAKVGTP
jgi:putative membrane protein